jgi:hypothetical protein
MQGIVVPASDMVFGAVKIQIAEKGWEEVFPQTDEEWLRLWQNSVVLAEAGNLLMVRGRPGARDQEDGWMSVARALSDGGVQAMKAAQAKDPKLFTEASEQIRATCSKCHLDYAPRRYARPAVNESDSKADVP